LCEDLAEMLFVAPRHEARVIVQCALRNASLGVNGAIRLEETECGEAYAGEKEDDGPANGGEPHKRTMQGPGAL
jgi:hypothetical protein